jgi:hypothetical protein
MKSLVAQLEFTQIHFDDLISTMGVVEKLERLSSAKDISKKLEDRCKGLAISHLNSANIVSKFVRDNCDNMAYVMRLLKNCDGLLYEPEPPKKVREIPLGTAMEYCRQCGVYHNKFWHVCQMTRS